LVRHFAVDRPAAPCEERQPCPRLGRHAPSARAAPAADRRIEMSRPSPRPVRRAGVPHSGAIVAYEQRRPRALRRGAIFSPNRIAFRFAAPALTTNRDTTTSAPAAASPVRAVPPNLGANAPHRVVDVAASDLEPCPRSDRANAIHRSQPMTAAAGCRSKRPSLFSRASKGLAPVSLNSRPPCPRACEHCPRLTLTHRRSIPRNSTTNCRSPEMGSSAPALAFASHHNPPHLASTKAFNVRDHRPADPRPRSLLVERPSRQGRRLGLTGRLTRPGACGRINRGIRRPDPATQSPQCWPRAPRHSAPPQHSRLDRYYFGPRLGAGLRA